MNFQSVAERRSLHVATAILGGIAFCVGIIIGVIYMPYYISCDLYDRWCYGRGVH